MDINQHNILTDMVQNMDTRTMTELLETSLMLIALHAQAIDAQDIKTKLCQRLQVHREVIDNGWRFLIHPHDQPLIPSKHGSLLMRLKDKMGQHRDSVMLVPSTIHVIRIFNQDPTMDEKILFRKLFNATVIDALLHQEECKVFCHLSA